MTQDMFQNNAADSGRPEQSDILARSVLATVRRTEQVLSPWVQRALQTGLEEPGSESENRFGRDRSATLTTANTQLLLNRLQRVTERSRVWRAETVSVTPDLIDRFAGEVATRVQVRPIAVQPEAPATETPSAQPSLDMTLAGGPPQPERESGKPAVSSSAPTPARRPRWTETDAQQPAPPHFMAKKQESRPAWLPKRPERPAASKPSVQTALQRQSAQEKQPEQPRLDPKKLRLFSKVEYVSFPEEGKITGGPLAAGSPPLEVPPASRAEERAEDASPPPEPEVKEPPVQQPGKASTEAKVDPASLPESAPPVEPVEPPRSRRPGVDPPVSPPRQIETPAETGVETAPPSVPTPSVQRAAEPEPPASLPESAPSVESAQPPRPHRIEADRPLFSPQEVEASDEAEVEDAPPRAAAPTPPVRRAVEPESPTVLPESTQPAEPSELSPVQRRIEADRPAPSRPRETELPVRADPVPPPARRTAGTEESIESLEQPYLDEARPPVSEPPSPVEPRRFVEVRPLPASPKPPRLPLRRKFEPEQFPESWKPVRPVEPEPKPTPAQLRLDEPRSQSEPKPPGEVDFASIRPDQPPAPTDTPPKPESALSARRQPDSSPQVVPPSSTGEQPPAQLGQALRARARSAGRLPLTGSRSLSGRVPALPPTLTARQARARLAARGWRFKRKQAEPPTDPRLVSRSVESLERAPGAGMPLPEEPRARVEERLGRDFSPVRLRPAPLAPLQVEAASREREVYLEPGQERVETPQAVALLGHELTHVAQRGLVQTKPAAQTTVLPQARADPEVDDTPAVQREEAEATKTEQQLLADSSPRLPAVSLASLPPRLYRKPAQGVKSSPASRTDPAPASDLPPLVTDWLASTDLARRQPLVTRPGISPIIQRVEESPPATPALGEAEEAEGAEGAAAELDLDQLAKQIYPILKRMLAVERERRFSRPRGY